MRTRLLHIIWEGGLGGAERLLVDLVSHLDLKKYNITVAILSRSGCITDQIDRGKVRVLEFGFSRGLDIMAFMPFLDFLRSNRFDIIHITGRTFLTNVALLTLKPRPVLLLHEQGGRLLRGELRSHLFYAVFRRLYDVFIAIHKEMAQCMMRAGRVPSEKIVIIENPVDIGYFSPSNEAERKLTSSKGHPTIGTVARFVPVKDLDLFLETARLIVRRQPEIQFVIVGDGPLRARLEAGSNDQDLKGKMSLPGPTLEVAKFLRSFDLFLFTSRIEPFGMTIIESLACGVPVVAALPEAGGARGLLKQLPGVCLVQERTPDALARAATALIEDPVLIRKMGQAGRKHVIANYSLTDCVKRIDSLYDRLLRERQGRKVGSN